MLLGLIKSSASTHLRGRQLRSSLHMKAKARCGQTPDHSKDWVMVLEMVQPGERFAPCLGPRCAPQGASRFCHDGFCRAKATSFFIAGEGREALYHTPPQVRARCARRQKVIISTNLTFMIQTTELSFTHVRADE